MCVFRSQMKRLNIYSIILFIRYKYFNDTSVWNPYFIKDVKELENIDRKKYPLLPDT